jgi:hypothetical protein
MQRSAHRDPDRERPGGARRQSNSAEPVRTWEAWLYLASVIDCCSRPIVSWVQADRLRAELFDDASDGRSPPAPAPTDRKIKTISDAQAAEAQTGDESQELLRVRFRDPVVWDAVPVVIESGDFALAEAGRVLPDRLGPVLVAVLRVFDEVGFSDVEALGLACLNQRRDSRVDSR